MYNSYNTIIYNSNYDLEKDDLIIINLSKERCIIAFVNHELGTDDECIDIARNILTPLGDKTYINQVKHVLILHGTNRVFPRDEIKNYRLVIYVPSCHKYYSLGKGDISKDHAIINPNL